MKQALQNTPGFEDGTLSQADFTPDGMSRGEAMQLAFVAKVASAIRMPQWSKNVLVFLPVFVTLSFDRQTMTNSFIAFCAFCCTASATYVINDLTDRVADRDHPHKRNRMFASNQLSPSAGYAIIGILTVFAALFAAQLPWEFSIVLLIYASASIAYTLLFKRMLGIDVVAIACLYVLRVVAGDEAIGAQFKGIDSSNWILAFSCLFFLSLAIVKRCSDLRHLRADPDGRMPGRAYRTEDYPVLIAFATASAMASIVILMRYIDSTTVTEYYSQPDTLWLIVPILVFWLLRMILLANRGKINEDPVFYTVKDTKSQLCAIAVGLIALAAL